MDVGLFASSAMDMKRRAMLGRIGTVGAAAVGYAGTATARESPTIDLEGTIDVSDVAGEVTLVELLDDSQLADLPDGVDPSRETVDITRGQNRFDAAHVCCALSCGYGCYICVDCDSITIE